jgi:threonine dehydrogenase-like Zn-dependent dehydrogenase
MRAAVLTGPCRMTVRDDVPVVSPGPTEVLLRVATVGLCGTDFHIFSGHGNYHADPHGRLVPLDVSPQILGHEFVGIVEEMGQRVGDLKRGDWVVVDQGRNCVSAGRPLCEYCATGDSHQCAFYGEHGITGLPGALAEFITVPAVNAIRFDDLPLDQAALTEPLACIVHASDVVERANARYRLRADTPDHEVRTVLIFGGGPAGLLFTQYLRRALSFDGQILVSEPNPAKRALAEQYGATTIDPRVSDLADAVETLTSGRRAEYAIDASGAGEVFVDLSRVVRKQGTILLYGHGHAGMDLSVLNNVQFLEPKLLSPVGASGGFEPDGRPTTYRRALALLETARIDVASFITHRYQSLDEVPNAFAGAHRQPDYVKGIVELQHLGLGPHASEEVPRAADPGLQAS